jgi:hypothetical protein
MSKTQKETIDYDTKALNEWKAWCDSNGYVKRQASHACRLAFMLLTAEQREQAMLQAMDFVVASRQRRSQKNRPKPQAPATVVRVVG